MTNREIFINEVHKLFTTYPNEVANEAKEYFDAEICKPVSKKISENGQKLLEYMTAHKEEKDNKFTAKEIAEGLGISSRSVSGSMRVLVNIGYVEKVSKDPVVYSLLVPTD